MAMVAEVMDLVTSGACLSAVLYWSNSSTKNSPKWKSFGAGEGGWTSSAIDSSPLIVGDEEAAAGG
eukprot:CAMPEP_0173200418 /NCGR_PEP_ID=MMETSP1141-20130122/17779_1 /TAXON_ID=483371 /ORGANISM="non described non described, Strain CCMP2298" /LENGTH=65 /DNA_ID=CAMNT_0014125415 /DNA_START=536 /DNA_END=733 /DNA_ORIENTATION=-